MIEDLVGLNQAKILIAEDNKTNLDVCLHFLRSFGVSDVRTVSNGLEAVEAVVEHPGEFDLILMDVRMPEMDGLEATREIVRRWPSPKNRPRIVALTAHAFEEESEKCFEAGMDGYLTKPIQKEPLIEAIKLHAIAHPEQTEPQEAGNVDFKQFDMVVDSPDSPCVAIYQNFVEGVKPQLAEIFKAAEASDFTVAKDLSHQLKGASSSFGFVAFSEMMKEAEARFKGSSGLAAIGEDWLEEVGEVFDRAVEKVKDSRGF